VLLVDFTGGTMRASPFTTDLYTIRALDSPLIVVRKPPAYVPFVTWMVVPGSATLAACWMVWKGDASVPGLLFEPSGET
jgi:hypothetical protein